MSEPKPKKPLSSHRWVLGYLMREKRIFLPSLGALFFTAILSLAFVWRWVRETKGMSLEDMHGELATK